MNKVSYIFVISLLLILNGYLLIKAKKNVYPEILEDYIYQQINDSISISKYKCAINSIVNNPHFITDLQEMILEDQDSEKENKKLILLFSDKMCHACIKESLIDLSLIDNQIGKNNIITLGQFERKSDLLEFNNTLNNEYSCVFYDRKLPCFFEEPIILLVKFNSLEKILLPELMPELRYGYNNNTILVFFND